MMDHMDWRMQLLGGLATAFLAILSAVVPLLVRAAIRYVEQRLHLELNEAQDQRLQSAAAQAVAWAEEQSRKAMAQNGVPLPSDRKLEQAKAFVRDALVRQGHLDLSRLNSDDILKQAIEAALNNRRTGAGGSAPDAPRPSATPPA